MRFESSDQRQKMKFLLLGSSVARGQGATSLKHSWGALLNQHIKTQNASHTWQNMGVDGTNTVWWREALQKITLPPSDVVMVSLSLANEGLIFTEDEKEIESVAGGFIDGVKEMEGMVYLLRNQCDEVSGSLRVQIPTAVN